MAEMIAALVAVLLAIVVLRKLLVRFGPRAFAQREPGRIRIVDSAALSLKQTVHLVEVDGTTLLLGASETGIVRLARLGGARVEAEPVEAPVPSGPGHAAAATLRRRRSWLHAIGQSLGVLCLAIVVVGSWPGIAVAAKTGAAADPTLSISIGGATGPDQISDTLKIVMVLTAISVAPSLLLMATCFTRILIVLALLRQALGTATLPPNQVLVGLALMTTFYVMTPVGEAVWADSVEPYMAKEIDGGNALERGIAPLSEFMLKHTREADLLLFVEMRGEEVPEDPKDVAISALMPAFMISEMRAAFEIGFMIYLPFLVVDLVIASMLISLGMIMLPPVMIALPFKLMLFVLVDGWNLTLTSLVAGLQ